MADSKITALTSISTSTDPAVDPLVIVDVSDTSMAASGTSKKVTLNNLLSSSPTATGAFSVTGLVTAGSATITGAATVGTTLGVTGVSTLASVGVTGAATVGTTLGVTGALTGQSTASFLTGTGLPLYIRNSGTSFTQVGDNVTIGAGTAFIVGSSDATLRFLCGGAEAGRFNSTGNLVLKGGTTGANGVGVTFPATQVASSDANCLDDYEEGTWTPTDGSGAGLVFSIGSCRYTKVGRLVTVQGSVTYPATASGANAIWGGFPFVAADNIFLTIAYTDTPIATFTYFSGVNNGVYLLTPGVNTINSSLSLRTITFFGNYMV